MLEYSNYTKRDESMGYGYRYLCKKCRTKYGMRLGVGVDFQKVYAQIVKRIKLGLYGEEWKELYLSRKFVAVNVEKNLYVCEGCGNWKTQFILDLYVPKDPDALKHETYGTKALEEWGFVPFASAHELSKDFKLLKSYYHKCPQCNRRMRKALKKDFEALPCPSCQRKNTYEKSILWD